MLLSLPYAPCLPRTASKSTLSILYRKIYAMSRESNPALAERRDSFVTVCNRIALDSYISPFKLLVLFYFHHSVSISEFFFMNIGDSILSLFRILFFPPSLNQAFSFLKARTEERVTRAGIRCRISRLPGEIWLHHFYCPFPWYTVLRCPYFPFIFIFSPLFPSTLRRLSRSSHFWTYSVMFLGNWSLGSRDSISL